MIGTGRYVVFIDKRKKSSDQRRSVPILFFPARIRVERIWYARADDVRYWSGEDFKAGEHLVSGLGVLEKSIVRLSLSLRVDL